MIFFSYEFVLKTDVISHHFQQLLVLCLLVSEQCDGLLHLFIFPLTCYYVLVVLKVVEFVMQT